MSKTQRDLCVSTRCGIVSFLIFCGGTGGASPDISRFPARAPARDSQRKFGIGFESALSRPNWVCFRFICVILQFPRLIALDPLLPATLRAERQDTALSRTGFESLVLPDLATSILQVFVSGSNPQNACVVLSECLQHRAGERRDSAGDVAGCSELGKKLAVTLIAGLYRSREEDEM